MLVGALVTYWINIRTRRRHRLEDQFDAAIAAVAVTDASKHYARRVTRPEEMPGDEFDALSLELVRMAFENYVKRAADAREAVARVAHYEPRLRPYFKDPALFDEKPQEVIALLLEAKRVVLDLQHSRWPGLPRGRRAS